MDGRAMDPLRQNILEAVDCLRQRKCRPDREAIAHYVLRKFGSSMNEIFAELENIVDEGGLIKVEYKGTTSYRSPSNFDTKNSPLLTKHSKILNSSKTTRLIITGINELLAKDPNFSKEGVPLTELKEILKGFDAERFADDKVELLVDREINYGSIIMAKSEVLNNSLRVFPKDIPVPGDMKIVSLSSDLPGGNDKEEKKPRKPRKSSSAGTSTASDAAKRGIKIKEEIKETEEEPENGTADLVFAVKSEPQTANKELPVLAIPVSVIQSPTTTNTKSKVARMIPASKKLVPEQIASAVRKTYEETIEFEATSARMMKLAEGLVTKVTSEVDESVKVKVPTLVLAESVNSSDEDKSQTTIKDEQKMDTSSSTETSPATNLSGGASNARKRARASVIKTKAEGEEEMAKSTSNVASPQSSPTNEQGLTRSKRDKRKKKVFDPSDLPNTYTSFTPVSKSSTGKRPRANRSLSSEEPPAKKAATVKGKARVAQTNNVSSKNKKNGKSKNKGKNGIDSSSVPVLIKQDGDKDDSMKKDGIIKEEDGTLNDQKSSKTCALCSDEPSKGTVGQAENILTCSSCKTNIHPRCIEYSAELTEKILKLLSGNNSRRYKWQCANCKTCKMCKVSCGLRIQPSNKDNSVDPPDTKVLLCSNCDEGCHIICYGNSVTKTESITAAGDKWICKECEVTTSKATQTAKKPKKEHGSTMKKTAKKAKAKPIAPVSKSPEVKSPVDSTDEYPSPEDADNEPGVDIQPWSVADVETFFISKGLKEEAAVLKENEVDGTSLLLLKREDIIHGMGFRLGPALKVNRLVVELQSKAPVKAKWASEFHSSAPVSHSDGPSN